MHTTCTECGSILDPLGPVKVTAAGVVLVCACCEDDPRPVGNEPPVVPEPSGTARRPPLLPTIAVATIGMLSIAAHHFDDGGAPAAERAAAMQPLATGTSTAPLTSGAVTMPASRARVVPIESGVEAMELDIDEVVSGITASAAPPTDWRQLVELHPTLKEWVHPVLDSDERTPDRNTRRFGARRDVDEPREECGEGHCGVDLGGPRGTPILAVAWGEIARVRRSGDGSAGKYVLIRHPEGALSAYMHLDSIPEYLGVGDEVEGGEIVGTLGRTGIEHSAAHLHFALQIPDRYGHRYIDPLPFLHRSTVLHPGN